MNETLRAELIARCAADGTAVAAVLATAEDHRVAWDATRTAGSNTPWPYVLLQWEPRATAPASVRRVLDVVDANTARLMVIVADHGWPGRDLVAEDGADAAWLLLQHAGSAVTTIGSPDTDAFVASCIPLLEAAVAAGQAHPRHLAHVVDGVAWKAGQPPVYAVLASAYRIVNGRAVFGRAVDAVTVDQRRTRIGLPTLAEDVTRRARGEPLSAAGSGQAEPWPSAPRRR